MPPAGRGGRRGLGTPTGARADGGQAIYVDTRLPWERGEAVGEDGPGELQVGEAG